MLNLIVTFVLGFSFGAFAMAVFTWAYVNQKLGKEEEEREPLDEWVGY